MSKVNIAEKFGLFDEAWTPKIAGQVNDMHLKLAKFRGDFQWHSHEKEDELFLVVKGTMRMAFRDRERVETLTRDFDELVRQAEFTARDVDGYLETLSTLIK